MLTHAEQLLKMIRKEIQDSPLNTDGLEDAAGWIENAIENIKAHEERDGGCEIYRIQESNWETTVIEGAR